MPRPFIIVPGLPGCGKTTLARQLASALDLLLIDKDDILDGLFDSRGTGDLTWRRALSRESDLIFQREAARPGRLDTGARIDVDTSRDFNLDAIVRDVRRASGVEAAG